MSLNLASGNMYNFVTHTWNPIKGKCKYGCIYCYMNNIKQSKTPYLAGRELSTNLGTTKLIAVCNSCDMFADIIPEDWIEKILKHCAKFDNEYFFQSKNIKKLVGFNLPKDKSYINATIETNRFDSKYMGETPPPEERAKFLPKGESITIEPIMDFDLEEFLDLIKSCEPKYVNIGADSGNNALPEPSKDKVKELIKGLESFTQVYQKENLFRILMA